MRLTMLILFLSVGTAALGQSSTQTPCHFEWQTENPSTTKPGIDLDNLFSSSRMKPFTPLEEFALPKEAAKGWSEDARIDPKMIVHPPQASLGVQTSGIPVVRNEFPDLQFLPIDKSRAVNPIPWQWPNLKVQAIPTQWPKVEVHPVE